MTKWTLVTGGAKNLGAEICLMLAQQGHNISIHYNKSTYEAEQVAQKCRECGVLADTIQGDFSEMNSLQDFISRYQCKFPLTDQLINNVGNYFLGSALNTSSHTWMQLFFNNLHAPFALIEALVPSIKKAKGSIINIGVAGCERIRADTYSTAYSCAKLALWMMTKSLAAELASSQVRVNMVSPGYLENSIDKPRDLLALPMSRVGNFSEVTRVITFLLAKESSYITGQNIEVAGGVRLS
jgi:NAD(P)-dependent dehydrogenase (short-subunit alcohol dehydrogenase family)